MRTIASPHEMKNRNCVMVFSEVTFLPAVGQQKDSFEWKINK